MTSIGFDHTEYLGDTLEACGNIDAIADDILTLDQDVAEVDADAPVHRSLAIPLLRSAVTNSIW